MRWVRRRATSGDQCGTARSREIGRPWCPTRTNGALEGLCKRGTAVGVGRCRGVLAGECDAYDRPSLPVLDVSCWYDESVFVRSIIPRQPITDCLTWPAKSSV